MIELEKTFTSGVAGYGANPRTFNQLKRNRLFAIYERKDSEGKIDCYEVIRIGLIKKGTKIPQFNKIYTDDQETYPGSNSWGTNGFSCNSLKFAEKKFAQLSENFEKEHGKTL